MRFRFAFALALLTTGGAGIACTTASAGEVGDGRLRVAQSAYTAIPKPSERRAGELEGWTDPDKKAPAKAAPGRKATAAAATKPKQKPAAEKQERDPDDGGLPLPSSKGKDNGLPVGFDSKGAVGTNLRF